MKNDLGKAVGFDILRVLKTYSFLFVFLTVILVLTVLSPNFFALQNFFNILNTMSVTLVVAMGLTLVMTSGGIDLSVGSNMSLTICIVGTLLRYGGVPWPIAFLVGILIGASAGAVNGVLIGMFNIPPLITTLGMLSLLRGLASFVTKGTTITLTDFRPLMFLGSGYLGVIPFSGVIALIIVAISFVILAKMELGYYIRAIGGNESAAKLLGINPRRIKMYIYTISGLFAGIGGLMVGGRLGSANPLIGDGMELSVIAAAFLGGNRLVGGEGKILGTVIGALIIGSLYSGLIIAGVQFFYQLVITGLALIFAVALNEFVARIERS